MLSSHILILFLLSFWSTWINYYKTRIAKLEKYLLNAFLNAVYPFGQFARHFC